MLHRNEVMQNRSGRERDVKGTNAREQNREKEN